MDSLSHFSEAVSDDDRSERIYRGEILVFQNVPALRRLAGMADQLLRETFDDADPPYAQGVFPCDAYLGRVDALQKRFKKDPQVTGLLRAALEHVGADLEKTYWDRIHFRVVPYGSTHSSYQTRTLHYHRDTWASNVYQQVNWWTPVYPVTIHNTVALYPKYWSTPIDNSSESWDLAELRVAKRSPKTKDLPGYGYPVVPKPLEAIDTSSELRVVIEPGDLLCFSAAHLHATVPNDSGAARFSMEFRTVYLDDLLCGRGAPNVDGHAPRVATSWFRHILTGTSLDTVLHPIDTATTAV